MKCNCSDEYFSPYFQRLVSLHFSPAKVKNCLMVLSRKPQLPSLLLWMPQAQIPQRIRGIINPSSAG